MSNIVSAITNATRCLSEYWPLPAFIASNPLWDMTAEPFQTVAQQLSDINMTMPLSFYQSLWQQDISESDLRAAIDEMQESNSDTWLHTLTTLTDMPAINNNILYCEQVGEYQFQNAKQWVKRRCCEWLLQYFGNDHHKEQQTLRQFWQPLACHNETLLAEHNDAEIITALLQQLDVPDTIAGVYLQQIFCSLYGWGSLIKWLEQHPDNPWLPHKANTTTVLIMWLYYEVQLYKQTKQPFTLSNLNKDGLNIHTKAKLIWQSAYEKAYHRDLLESLSTKQAVLEKTPEAQLICCIDTRSEGLRRHLEHTGNYQTFGFAGFFGFAFALQNGENQSLQCPALVSPDLILQVQQQHLSMLSVLKHATLATKKPLLSPFVLFEVFGLWLLPALLAKTFTPSLWSKRHALPEINIDFKSKNTALSLSAAVEAAGQLLQTINLTNNFAPTVVICAHQSTSNNNPFAAALDCGACGGNSGIPNAIVAAQILNHPEVRAGLAVQGIDIPDSTQFIAGCHHTVRDEVVLFTTQKLDALRRDLNQACRHLRKERQTDLPGKRSTVQREHNWAELMPELGLANNAAMIIGPRSISQHADLQRRVFLHSYQPKADTDGVILEAILCAPMVVAHWINSQYYFSTVNPEQFGAGNKAVHNVIPGIGVMTGNLSDLKIGLPEQSVRYQNSLLHEPRRLFVVIYAPQDRVEAIFAKHAHLKALRDGGWITVKVIESV